MVAVLYSQTNILCILLLLLITFKLKSSIHMQYSKRFLRWVLLSNCFFFVLDALWIFVDSKRMSINITANWTLNVLYYITSGVVSFLWFLYSEESQQSSLVKDKRHIFLCAIPMLLIAALSLISIKTGWLFYVDELNFYHRGPLYSLQLLLSCGYILFTAIKALVLSFQTHSYANKKKYRTLAMFVLPSLITGGIQVLLPGISLISIGTTFGLLYVFTTIQEQMIYVDSLTGLNNRSRMTQYLSEKMCRIENDTRLFLVMMDLDYFKQINDNYGHVEGDNALRKTAEALKTGSSSRRCFLSRYGGDEFAAVCELNANESIEGLCRCIREAVSAASEALPYTLSLSMGYAEFSKDIKTDQDFIKLADAELYKVKRAR